MATRVWEIEEPSWKANSPEANALNVRAFRLPPNFDRYQPSKFGGGDLSFHLTFLGSEPYFPFLG